MPHFSHLLPSCTQLLLHYHLSVDWSVCLEHVSEETCGQVTGPASTTTGLPAEGSPCIGASCQEWFAPTQQLSSASTQQPAATPFPDLTTLIELQREALQLMKELIVRVNALENVAAVPNPPQQTTSQLTPAMPRPAKQRRKPNRRWLPLPTICWTLWWL